MTVTDEKNQQLIEFLESMGYSSFAINGYKIINRYSDQEIELDAIYNGVSLRNISHQGIIELKGKDAIDLVHRIATNNVKNLPKEGVRSTIFTTEKGRIISVATLMNFENYQLLVCDRINKMKVISWLRKYVINDDVEVNDANTKYNLLELSGPQAESFATLICGNLISEIQPGNFRIVHTENILFFVIKLLGERNKNKFWFLADFENSKRLINYMNVNRGVFHFSMIGEEAYNIYRVENGLPTSPNELSDEYNPLEAGLVDLIDFEKGCYIGQEVIARLQNYEKIQKRLIGVKFNQQLDYNNEQLILEGNGIEAGRVTSYVFSYKLKEPIGLAYIKNNFLKPGTQLTVKYSIDKPVKAEVYPLPFIK